MIPVCWLFFDSFQILLRTKTDITTCNIQQDKVCMNGASIRQMVLEQSEDVRESLWKRSDRKRRWSEFLTPDVSSWYLWLRSHKISRSSLLLSFSVLFILCLIISNSILTVSHEQWSVLFLLVFVCLYSLLCLLLFRRKCEISQW